MNIKVKIIKENKEKRNEEQEKLAGKKTGDNVNESLTSILTDPVALASLAAALGVGVSALKGVLGGGGSSSTLDDIRDKINADAAYADELTRASREKREREQKFKKAKYGKQLDDMKAARAERGGEDQISLQLSDGGMSADPTSSQEIPDTVVRRYVRAKRMADDPRTDSGSAQNAQKKVDKFRAEYPDIDNHPDIGLYESFNRFL